MKNHIFVKSRSDFKKELEQITAQQFMSGAFISIHTPKFEEIILQTADNVLNLVFHDSDLDTFIKNEVLFDEDMAKQVWNFVEKNQNAKFWLIHCTAGKCRSGAVGEFLQEFFQIDYFQFKQDNLQIQPNVFVKNILFEYFD